MKSKKIIWIADFYVEQIAGGGELVNEVMISMLQSMGYEVEKWLSYETTPELLNKNIESFVVVANFTMLPVLSINFIAENFNYIIYEHDHKYLKTVDPSPFENYIAPADVVQGLRFYKNAVGVVCQSELHAKVLQKNLITPNVVAMNCSLWSEKEIATLRKYLNVEKNGKFFVLNSENPIKNTKLSIKFCEDKDVEYDVHGPLEYDDLIKTMASYETVVFFPKVLETFNRYIIEARVLNCKLVTNKKSGAVNQKWFSKLKGAELLDFIEENNKESALQISKLIETGKCDWLLDPIEYPKVSLITSMYKGEKHIRAFLENITSQTIFDHCELIIINANSPENEEPIILEYMEKYNNIFYRKLDQDPGIYGAWNIAIEMSTGELISNANLDDRRSVNHLEMHVRELILRPEIDLVYSEAIVTDKELEIFSLDSVKGQVYPVADFSKEAMIKCLPGCMPVWRRSMHSGIGLFNAKLKSAGDWEMWLRAVRNESQFKKIPGHHGLYYANPDGLSTSDSNQKERFLEEKEVFWQYIDIFGREGTKYTSYFGENSKKFKKIICFSLWGDNPIYTIGAIRNAELAKIHYPDWVCRYYVGSSAPKDILYELQSFDNTEVIEMAEEGDWTGMFWRFCAASDPDVYAMISRDTDSRLNKREALAVKRWIESDKDFHIMRDHPYHATQILGGMWGVKNGALQNMKKMINEYVKGDFWQVDQNFLKEKIYPLIKANHIVHDEFFENAPFPTKREPGIFIGQAFDQNDEPLHPEHMEILKKGQLR